MGQDWLVRVRMRQRRATHLFLFAANGGRQDSPGWPRGALLLGIAFRHERRTRLRYGVSAFKYSPRSVPDSADKDRSCMGRGARGASGLVTLYAAFHAGPGDPARWRRRTRR